MYGMQSCCQKTFATVDATASLPSPSMRTHPSSLHLIGTIIDVSSRMDDIHSVHDFFVVYLAAPTSIMLHGVKNRAFTSKSRKRFIKRLLGRGLVGNLK